MGNLFQDRTEAGQVLATRLTYFAHRPDVLVLALSNGSMPVAAEVARELRAPLDLFLMRELAVPEHEELAMGAVAPGGVLIVNEVVVQRLDIPEETLNAAALREGRELQEHEKVYRPDRPASALGRQIIILIDDGLATEVVLRGAVAALRQHEPAAIVVAVPIAARGLCAELATEVEQTVCLEMQEPAYAVGLYYRHFPQVTDDEVRELLQQSTADLRQTTHNIEESIL